MGAVWGTFANNLAPIFLVAGLGYWLGVRFQLDSAPLSRLVFYLFGPALVFDLIVANDLNGREVWLVGLIAAGGMALTGGLAWWLGQSMGLGRRAQASLALTAAFPNAGNYGLPLVGFAFGARAQALAGIYFIVTAIVFNTVGVFVASLGRLSWRQAWLATLRVPMMYAVVVALVVNRLAFALPVPVARTVGLLAEGAIPAMLVLLGLELRKASFTHRGKMLSVGLAARLLLSPLLAWGGLSLAGIAAQTDLGRAVLVEAAMPVAVTTTVLAVEYELDAPYISMIVFASTLISPLTVTVLLRFLGS